MYFTVYKLYPKQIEQKYYGNVGTGFESGTNFWIITMWPFKSYIYIKKKLCQWVRCCYPHVTDERRVGVPGLRSHS